MAAQNRHYYGSSPAYVQLNGGGMEVQLIEYVRNHPCLFNIKSKEYRNQAMKQVAWEEIAAEMNTTVSNVRDTWGKLRNCWASAKKRRESKSGQAASKIVPWKFEKEMSFLIPFLEMRQTSSNFPQSSQDDTQAEDVEENHIEANSQIIDLSQSDANLSNGIQLEQNDNVEEIPSMQTPPMQTQNKRKRTSSPQSSPAREIVKIMKQNAESRRERQKPDLDEVDMFYLSMAKTIKKLPRADQAKIRMTVCTLVSEAELRQEEIRSSACSSDRPTVAADRPRDFFSPAPSSYNTLSEESHGSSSHISSPQYSSTQKCFTNAFQNCSSHSDYEYLH